MNTSIIPVTSGSPDDAELKADSQHQFPSGHPATAHDVELQLRPIVENYCRQEWLPDRSECHALDEFERVAAESIPHSDLFAVKQLMACVGELVHYWPESKEWLVWNGRFHAVVEHVDVGQVLAVILADVMRESLSAVKKYYVDVSSVLAGEARDQKMKEYGGTSKSKFGPHRAYRDRIHDNAGLNGLARRIEIQFSTNRAAFDADDHRWLVMRDGSVLDMQRFVLYGLDLLPPEPSRLVTRALGSVLRSEFDAEPGARPAGALWHAWLDEMIPDEDVQHFLQICAGAALLGEGRLKVILNFVGPKDSGKSTYNNLLSKVFGGYAKALDSNTLSTRSGGGSNFSKSSARGVRWLTLSEPSTHTCDDGFLKSISGSGDEIVTDRKNRDEVSWRAQCVLSIASNEPIRFNTSDPAIVQRVCLIEMVNQLEKPDATLEEQILNYDDDYMLNWVVEGMLEYLALENEPVAIPESVRKHQDENVRSNSSVLTFLDELESDGRVQIDTEQPYKLNRYMKPKDLYGQYWIWAPMNGYAKPVNKVLFRKEIEKHLGWKRETPPKSGGHDRLFRVIAIDPLLTA